LRKDLDLALDILSDMYKNSLFREEDIQNEKSVVIQEIKMVEDNPEEYIYDMFNASYFRGHPLGMPILGKAENIQEFDADMLLTHFERHYNPKNLIITATGRIDHLCFTEKVDSLFKDVKPQDCEAMTLSKPSPYRSFEIYERDLEHIYLCIGTNGASQVERKRYPLYVLNAVMGGSMSSHLFQEIREKRGLVYNIYSYVNCYYDTGTFGISTSTSLESIREVLMLVREEIERIRDKGISENELSFSKGHIKGNLFMSMESSEARMGRLAKNEIYFGKYIPMKETIREIDTIKKEEVDEIGKEIFKGFNEIAVTLLGRVEKEGLEEIWKD